jgi:hypothetical protein
VLWDEFALGVKIIHARENPTKEKTRNTPILGKKLTR